MNWSKFIVSTLLIGLLSFASGLYLPWWGIALAAVVVSLVIPQRPGLAFFSGFLAVFLLWALLAWGIDAANESILSRKIAQILPLGGSPVLLILVTALVGALVGGLAALSGSYLKPAR
ncbi:MAG TPA: hypothetical protein VK563_07475 [Puia sp.]|nr:hypothetical protein [Puia sp.]